MGRGNEVECDLPIIENVDHVVVSVAVNAGTMGELKARAILIKRLIEFGEVIFSFQHPLVLETLQRLEAVVLVIPLRPVPGHVRAPEVVFSVDVKRLKRIGWFVVAWSRRIKPFFGVECLEDGDKAIHVASC